MGRFSEYLQTLNPINGYIVNSRGNRVNRADIMQRIDGAMDPFGASRTVEFQPQFSSQPLIVSTLNDRVFTTGTADVVVDGGEYKLTNPGGETCRLESGQRGRYRSGVVGVPSIGVRRTTVPTGTTTYRYGYFDTNDGFGIKEDSSGLHTFIRQAGVEVHSKPRSEWLDPLDGTGPSGRNIPDLDGRVVRMPYTWDGYGTVVIGIMAPDAPEHDEDLIVVDRWSPTGSLSFANPNLPVSAEIEGDSAGELFVGGRQYGVYGRVNEQRRIVGEIRTGQAIDSVDGFIPAVSARVRNEVPWSRIPIQVEGVTIFTDVDIDWYVAIGATLNQATWAISQFSAAGETSTEFDITATSFTGGELVAGPSLIRGGGGANNQVGQNDFPPQDIPVGEPVTLAVRAHAGTGTIRSVLRMAELL